MYHLANQSIVNVPLDPPEPTAHDRHWAVDQGPGVSIHTGFPNPAIDTGMPELDLHRLLITHSTGTYLMRIVGSDWQHLGIFDGDIAVVDRILPVASQDIVIWWYDGDFAISERARIRPESTVWGVVTATIHQFTQTGVSR